jgi:hypothetical protein
MRCIINSPIRHGPACERRLPGVELNEYGGMQYSKAGKDID